MKRLIEGKLRLLITVENHGDETPKETAGSPDVKRVNKKHKHSKHSKLYKVGITLNTFVLIYSGGARCSSMVECPLMVQGVLSINPSS